MDCRIVGLAQDVNFEENVSQTFIILQLPDRTQIRAAIDPITAERIVTLQVEVRGTAPQPRVRAPVVAVPMVSELATTTDDPAPEVSEFGGEGDVTVFGGPDTGSSSPPTPPAPPPDDDDDEPDDYDIPPAPPEVEAASAAEEAEYNQMAGLQADGTPLRQRRGKEAHAKKKARTQQGQAKPGGRKNLFRTTDGRLVAPAKTVPRNDAGFPVVANGVDPDALTGGNTDEDGIGSV